MYSRLLLALYFTTHVYMKHIFFETSISVMISLQLCDDPISKHMPMIVEPRPWTGLKTGGCLSIDETVGWSEITIIKQHFYEYLLLNVCIHVCIYACTCLTCLTCWSLFSRPGCALISTNSTRALIHTNWEMQLTWNHHSIPKIMISIESW